jgi:hypothetical protein
VFSTRDNHSTKEGTLMRTFLQHRARRGRARTWIAGGALVALAACGIAAADSALSGASLASATFYANTLSGSTNSQTCTASNSNTIQVTDATFTGTATSTTDPSLNGPLTIRVRSVYDSTTNAGWLTADFVVANSSATPPASFEGRLTAVNDNGTVQGLLRGGQGAGIDLLGNVTSTFSATGGFGSSGSQGSIGTGSATDTAIVSSGTCSPAMPPPGPNPPLPHGFKPFPTNPPFPHGFKPFSFHQHGPGQGQGQGGDNDND